MAVVLAGAGIGAWIQQRKLDAQAQCIAELTTQNRVLKLKTTPLDAWIKNTDLAPVRRKIVFDADRSNYGATTKWEWKTYLPVESKVHFVVDGTDKTEAVELPDGFFRLTISVGTKKDGTAALEFKIPEAAPEGKKAWTAEIGISGAANDDYQDYRRVGLKDSAENFGRVTLLRLVRLPKDAADKPITVEMVPVEVEKK